CARFSYDGLWYFDVW
nr:immunoglobulin heavy chain junction region [Mus musculus]